jgi:hypothetical protein
MPPLINIVKHICKHCSSIDLKVETNYITWYIYFELLFKNIAIRTTDIIVVKDWKNKWYPIYS